VVGSPSSPPFIARCGCGFGDATFAPGVLRLQIPFSCWRQIETDEQPAVISIASPTIEKNALHCLSSANRVTSTRSCVPRRRCGIFRSQLVGVDLIRT
jgi:hypothetical protein